MPIRFSFTRAAPLLVIAAGLLLPGAASAQVTAASPDSPAWRYSASVYGYLPSIGGTTAFPPASGSTPINISVDTILDSLKFTFMGTLEANNGRWGFFTDVIYLDVGDSKTQSRELTVGNVGLPIGTSANIDLDVKSWVWTVAGEYRLQSDPALTLDLLAGTRMIDLQQRLRWSISGNLGSIDPLNRSGTSQVSQQLWDGIIGVKGRYALGAAREWSVPFYLDVGAGQSTLTWQVATGVSYAFKWGELSGLWRYIGYDMKSGKAIQDVNFNGPVIGATFRW